MEDTVNPAPLPAPAKTQPTATAAHPESPRVTFAEFVERHHVELVRFLRSRVHSEDDALDLAQECYTRLLRYRDDHDAASLQFLLFRIARNLLTDSWRTRKAQHQDAHVPVDDLELEAAQPTQLDLVHGEQQMAALKRVIHRLPPRCQAVFVFSRIDGLSHNDIARRCGISTRAVEKHITKALAACRAALGEDDET